LSCSVDETVERFHVMSHFTNIAIGVDKDSIANEFGFFTVIVFAASNVAIVMRKFTTIIIVAFFV